MHPHWHSSSPAIQQRLISLFLASLSPDAPLRTPLDSPELTPFESELAYIHDPHDVAAVLRWGLRHYLPTGALGGANEWYDVFSTAERAQDYPAHAYSAELELTDAERALLTALLDVTFSLATRSEVNGVSGSKLSKLVGLWVLDARRAHEADDWKAFYTRWERAGRMLEHLFLARIR